jgi:hypothetical protein
MPPKLDDKALILKAEKEQDSVKVSLSWLEKIFNDNATTPIPEIKVDHYLETVANNQAKIEDTFQRIVAVCDPADLDPHTINYTSLLDRAVELKFQFSVIKKAFVQVPTASTASTAASQSTSSGSDIRLPRLTLPTFDGKIEEWTTFKDMFTTAIHGSKQLSDSQKLTYLKAQLKREAARQVQSLVISDANYAIAWKQLSDRYQNDRQLLFALLKKITRQPQVVAASVSSLRQLIDTSKECMRSLEVLSQPVKQWDSILLFILYEKLDQGSKELFEQTLKDSTIPKLQSLFDFLEQRSRALEAGGVRYQNQNNNANRVNDTARQSPRPNRVHHAHSGPQCKACNGSDHPINRCSKFFQMPIQDRADMVKKSGLCFNCLREGHSSTNCPSYNVCRTCGAKHHSLLHKPQPAQQSKSSHSDKPILTHHSNSSEASQTLLATAKIHVKTSYGTTVVLRVLLDGGSDTHIISEKVAKKLGFKWKRIFTEIKGLSLTPVGTTKGIFDLEFTPHFDSTAIIQARGVRVMSTLTSHLPHYPCNPNLSHLSGLQLADDQWHTPGDIDMLIGAGLVYELLCGEKLYGEQGEPLAVSSPIGWLVAGEIGNLQASCSSYHANVNTHLSQSEAQPSRIQVAQADVDLDQTLRKFWELESVKTEVPLTPEEKKCEEHFLAHTKQREDGKFVVSLPFKVSPPEIGTSRVMAISRLKYLERRLASNNDHKKEYVDFMREYIELGHMEEVCPDQVYTKPGNYIPHHFVLKESSTTTKFRVVFDASAKTSNGKSLNDNLLVGATIQDSLFNIMIRFRNHPVAFTADIAKMYRQILVDPADVNYQRIVWRENPNDLIKDYNLLTVTYGTASAPFQATRALKQLALLNKDLPLASEIWIRDLYVDDLMSGAESVEKALELQNQLLSLAKREDMKETKSLLPMEITQTVKTLGVFWQPQSDCFLFSHCS